VISTTHIPAWPDQLNTSQAMSGKSVKKLSVLLPANLHMRAKRQALLSDQSLTDLIITLLSNHLDSAEQEQVHNKQSS
jgi:hypothetical protein